MADIAMCLNSNCDRKYVCHRFTAKPHPTRQSFFSSDTSKGNGSKCDHYLTNEGRYENELRR